MADELILRPGWDNTDVVAGLRAMETAVVQSFSRTTASSRAFGGATGQSIEHLGQLQARFGSVTQSADRFNQSLTRMSQGFTSGLGIGVAIGGLALLEKGFEKAIEKAKQFQTAQLSIAAELTSSYKYTTPGGGSLGAADTYTRNLRESAKIVDSIIQRQAHNILTFQEELKAYQVSVAPGARKGLDSKQILDTSERLAIVGKSLGLSGERLANNVRILMGGGVNAARSVLGAGLGISNKDIQSHQGEDFVKFIGEKTKGFGGASTQNFKESIAGVLSTTQTAIDVFAAKVGQKFFDRTKPLIQELGKSLEGIDADKVANTMATLFSAIAKGLESIAKSPVIPEITKFLDLLAGSADKIVIGLVILKIASAMNMARNAALGFGEVLKGVGINAELAAKATEEDAIATRDLAKSQAELIATTKKGSQNNPVSSYISRGRNESGILGSEADLLGVGGVAGASLGRTENEINAGIRGTTGNLSGYPSPYNLTPAQIARNAEARALAKGQALKQEEAFGLFASQQSHALNPETAEMVASRDAAEAATAEQRLAANEARRKALREDRVNRGMRGLQFGGLAYLGGDFVRSATGTGGDENYIAQGLQSGVSVGVGLAGAGVPAPMAAGAAAITSIVSTVASGLSSFDDAVRKSRDNLLAGDKKNPQGAIVRDNKAEMAKIDKEIADIKAGKGGKIISQSNADPTEVFLNGAYRDMLGILGGGVLRLGGGVDRLEPDILRATTTNDPRSAAILESRRAELELENTKQARIAKATPENIDKEKGQADEEVKRRAAMLTSLGLGYGVDVDRQKIAQEKSVKDAQIEAAREHQTLTISPEVKKRADAEYAAMQRDITTKEGLAASFAKQGKDFPISYTENEQKYQSAGELEQARQAEVSKKQNAARTRVQEQLFPLQNQLNALSLGDSGSNVVAAAEAAYKVADIKLKDLQDSFHIPASQIAELRLQNRAKLDVAKLQKAYEENTGDFGDNDYEQALNKARSGLVQKTLARYGDIYGAQGNTPQEGLARKESEIEGKRGEVNDLEAYRGQALSTYEKQNALSALGGGGLTVDEQVSRSMQAAQERLNDNGLAQQAENENFARRTQDRRTEVAENPLRIAEADRNAESAQLNARKAALAPVLESGQGPYGGVASAIQYSVQAEQGFDPQAYEAAYRESIDIKKKEATLAQENANLQVQEAQVARQRLGLQLERTDEDYQKAVNEHNAAIRKLAQSAQELSEGMARAQADLAQAAQYAAGGTNAVRQGAIAEINGLTQQAGIKSFNISPTLNTTVNVTAGEVNLSADELDKIGRTVKDSIERDIDRACKRS